MGTHTVMLMIQYKFTGLPPEIQMDKLKIHFIGQNCVLLMIVSVSAQRMLNGIILYQCACVYSACDRFLHDHK